MGSFYVSVCVSDLSATQLEQWLEQQPFASYFGPTEDNWTCLVSEPLDKQDQKVIDAFGFILTGGAQRKAVAVLNHDDDILTVDVYEDGQRSGSYNSCPGYFKRDPSPEDLKPRLASPEAFARMRPLLESDQIVRALTDTATTDPWDIHSALVSLLGLPHYSIGMGFRYVARGESPADWTFVAGTNDTTRNASD
jgi:hypothetical protein